jgi:hypothetical protein
MHFMESRTGKLLALDSDDGSPCLRDGLLVVVKQVY